MSQPLTYRVDRSGRRKHTYLTIQKDGTLLVRANLTISQKAIEAFVTSKREWIEERITALREAEEHARTHFMLLGKQQAREGRTEEEIDALYRETVKTILPPLVERYSEEMGLFPTRVSFRKNRSRWGSCSSQDALSFNIQLAQTPLEFIEYVVVHELAHIRHKNHSGAFWKLVAAHLPDYKARQKHVKERRYLL